MLGPPKSRASVRVVGFPRSLVAVLRRHLAAYVGESVDMLVFAGTERPAAAQHLLRLRTAGDITDSAVAAYLAKYATKSTETTGYTSARLTAATVDALPVELDQDDEDDGPAGALVPAGQ